MYSRPQAQVLAQDRWNSTGNAFGVRMFACIPR